MLGTFGNVFPRVYFHKSQLNFVARLPSHGFYERTHPSILCTKLTTANIKSEMENPESEIRSSKRIKFRSMT